MSYWDALNKTINSALGTSATYSYQDGTPDSTIYGVFDNAFIEVLGVVSQKPVLKNVNLSDLMAEPEEGDLVTINSVVYRVSTHEMDTFGITTIILEKI